MPADLIIHMERIPWCDDPEIQATVIWKTIYQTLNNISWVEELNTTQTSQIKWNNEYITDLLVNAITRTRIQHRINGNLYTISVKIETSEQLLSLTLIKEKE